MCRLSERADDLIEIADHELDLNTAIEHVTCEGAGGIDVFIGTTRVEVAPNGKRLAALEYECYESMAVTRIEQICSQVRARWQVQKMAVLHRIGRVAVARASVIVAVSSAHRAEAFDACRFLIDELKRSVPIWKKEVWEDGSVTWAEGSMPASGG
jgi:molybdopterin synthase catalytic subunit